MRILTLLVLLFVATCSGVKIKTPSRSSLNIPKSFGEVRTPEWDLLDTFLQEGVENGTFPGAVALIGNKNGILYSSAKGSYTYGIPTPNNPNYNPAMQLSTLFDMASCSKVTACTTSVAQFYQRGELNLDAPITDFLGDEFGVNGKEGITVRNCLLHNSGFFPDPNPFWNTPEFGCPATADYNPPLEFTCQNKIYNNILNQTLQNPIGSTYVYSDLNFMTLMYVVGNLVKDFGYINANQLAPVVITVVQRMPNATMKLTLENMYLLINVLQLKKDPLYMHPTIQSVVSDGNAYALGGISGHAGVFSNAEDMWTFMYTLMFSSSDSQYLNSTTVEYFTTEYNHTQSSRALGWNTNDPTVNDEGWGLACGSLSSKTWMHLGYTGTMLCGDPERELILILLTNRVYPDPSNTKISNFRRPFSTLAQKIYDSTVGYSTD
ncbi:hypothetical protein DICPUDRAFT_87026 [Dictyostelium purpureum]|uniref:Beta-lactamase-related domain-containing protein n=1 Tax=Dictyostelium purpureum TaxID=5786 RepID=F0ZFG5_DICPU|nr:uncharacterized protein DICPUDRAFT_87026 [Dictyostelium purpureum]EGC37335.1 hypothetical protein DICPUDRAFT_87026 [Dictyostelium purpureum]|eukprot:XP_003286149.1 hypothetical protein DICPUDRAFT_87026 [Dictyostelium purpureum]